MKKLKNSYLLMLILMFLVSCESNLFRIDDKGCIIGNKPINYIETKPKGAVLRRVDAGHRGVIAQTRQRQRDRKSVV